MKKILLILIVLLTACSSKEPIKIGYANTMSGINASFGIDGMYGVEMAIEKFNSEGGINGRPIELIIKDDKANPLIAVNVDNELKAEGVVAIIGHGFSKVAEATTKNATENNILLISPTISTSSLTGLDDNFIRVIPDTSSQGDVICEMLDNLVNERVTIITEQLNLAYTQDVSLSLKTCLDSNNILYDEISFISGIVSEYEKVSSMIIELDNDHVVLIASSSDVVNIEVILHSYNGEYEIFLSTWGTTNEIFRIGDTHEDEIHGVGYYDILGENLKYIELRDAYKSRYGKSISFSALFAYEAAMALFTAMSEAESFTTADIKESLLNRTFDGIMNTFTIDGFGDTTRMAYELVFEEKEFVLHD